MRAMTPERWKQIDQRAQAAIERGGDERASFLDAACASDEALRREVESHIQSLKMRQGLLCKLMTRMLRRTARWRLLNGITTGMRLAQKENISEPLN